MANWPADTQKKIRKDNCAENFHGRSSNTTRPSLPEQGWRGSPVKTREGSLFCVPLVSRGLPGWDGSTEMPSNEPATAAPAAEAVAAAAVAAAATAVAAAAGGRNRSRSRTRGTGSSTVVRIGKGHDVFRSGALHWCRICGAYAEQRFKALKDDCLGPAWGVQSGTTGKARQGRAPPEGGETAAAS